MDDIKDILKEYEKFAPNLLKIGTAGGELIPLNLNKAQLYVHKKLEEQKAKFGYVRAIIPKARKLGVSTYIGSRYYHQLTTNKYKQGVVLSDTAANADELFGIYTRFYDNIPKQLRPKATSYNTKSLKFASIDSSLKVSSAASANVGRGATNHFMHLSEISSWIDIEETVSSIMQSIKLVPGTECVIESTAKGHDHFFKMWNAAQAVDSVWIPIFLPWTLDDEYSLAVPETFIMSKEEKEYAVNYELTPEQIYWRRTKINELGLFRFNQEYPLVPSDCFSIKDTDTLFEIEPIVKARKYKGDPNKNVKHPLVLGVDVAEYGSDRTVICWRRGREVEKFESYSKLGAVDISNILTKHIDKDKPAKVFVDVAKGSAIVDILRSHGYNDIEMIAFGGKAVDTNNYFNQRSYMYGMLKEWIEEEPCKLPDNEDCDRLEGELTSTGYKYDKDGRLQLVPKDDIKKVLGRSPDYADSLALSFAFPLGIALSGSEINAWQKLKEREPIYDW